MNKKRLRSLIFNREQASISERKASALIDELPATRQTIFYEAKSRETIPNWSREWRDGEQAAKRTRWFAP